MTATDLQEGKLKLKHSIQRINEYSEELHFYQGNIEKLQYVKEPCFVLFSKLLKVGLNGQEQEFEHLTVAYINNTCKLEIPGEATHFSFVTEPPVFDQLAKVLQQRFSADKTNFPLKYPAQNPFQIE